MDLDEDGQDRFGFGTPDGKSEFMIPNGWWVAKLGYWPVKPKDFLSESRPDYPRRKSRVRPFGVPVNQIRYGVTKCYIDMQNEGRVHAWEYVVIAPQPFVLVTDTGYHLGKGYSVAARERNGSIEKSVPTHIDLTFVRGANRWRWVRLQQVFDGLRVGFDDVPELFWELIAESVMLKEPEFENDSYSHMTCLDVVLREPGAGAIKAQIPPCTFAGHGLPPILSEFLIDQVFIPAGAAVDLVHLFKFVTAEEVSAW